ncbi:iron ABC transporter permease [Labrys sp. WJW]|nr:iron ABC transporter permease [Labrys sp. WJW]
MPADQTHQVWSPALEAHRRILQRRRLVIVALALAVVFACFIDIATGPSGMGLSTVIHGIVSPSAVAPRDLLILWAVRLPVALMAVLVGAALALAGAEMQTILDNPLASPFTTGLSSAGTLGAGLVIVLGISLPWPSSDWLLPASAFVCAFGSALLLKGLSMLREGRETLVLVGIALFFTFNAVVALLQFVASEQALQQFVFWSLGSLVRADWQRVAMLATVLALVSAFSFRVRHQLTVLKLGSDRARTLGLDVERMRFFALMRISLLTGAAVAFVGAIGFVGLIGPHAARLLVGEDHRLYLPASVLSGALIMSLASVASKSIIPGTLLPIGIVTALIGIPGFLLLVVTRTDHR